MAQIVPKSPADSLVEVVSPAKVLAEPATGLRLLTDSVARVDWAAPAGSVALAGFAALTNLSAFGSSLAELQAADSATAARSTTVRLAPVADMGFTKYVSVHWDRSSEVRARSFGRGQPRCRSSPGTGEWLGEQTFRLPSF